MNKQVKRISDMESILNHSEELLDELQALLEEYEELIPDLDRLIDYYHSKEYKDDLEADKKGLIPQDLPRGVLSEDGIYNMIFSRKQILEIMKEIIEKGE